MSDTVKLAILASATGLIVFAVNRALQLRAARAAERVKSDDNPHNDDAYDTLEEDLANDTKDSPK